ncbi:hypothetical protein WA588_000628 [Blastocystis sp. NMH]
MGNKNGKERSTSEEASVVDEVLQKREPLKESPKLTKNDFELLKTVGKGSFGKVFQVRYKGDGKIYAMKILDKQVVLERNQYEHTLAERRIMGECEHPFLVCLRFAFQSQTKLYLISDFFNGGELFYYLSNGRFSENRARFYAAEIALGLHYLHSQGIVYRDLKPENLLLDADGHIRITDFGLSKPDVSGNELRSLCGTPEYLAPEIIMKKPYGKAVDWWSLGTLIYEMIAGLPPYYDRNKRVMYNRILTAPLNRCSFMSPEAYDICQRFLDRNPETRLGSASFEDICNHPWFASIDWEKLFNKQVVPPFKPVVKGAEDVENVDSEFLQELPTVTPTFEGKALTDPSAFEGFSYNPNQMYNS